MQMAPVGTKNANPVGRPGGRVSNEAGADRAARSGSYPRLPEPGTSRLTVGPLAST